MEGTGRVYFIAALLLGIFGLACVALADVFNLLLDILGLLFSSSSRTGSGGARQLGWALMGLAVGAALMG